MKSDEIIYQFTNVTKSYDGSTILEIPRLSLIRGQACALVGPNGSGKTTLLKLLALIERPTKGEIRFDAMRVWNGSTNHTLLMRRITMVTQPPFLFNRSVAYNIAYGLKPEEIERVCSNLIEVIDSH